MATELEFWCSRLDVADTEELDARIRLTIRAQEDDHAPRSIAIACNEDAASILWDGPPIERLRVDETPGLVEGVLDAIERRVAMGPREMPKPVASPEPVEEDVPEPEATPRAGEDREEQFQRLSRIGLGALTGGAGIRLVGEYLPNPRVGMFGPQLDIGVGASGPFAFVLSEGVRFSTGDPATQLIDIQIGVAWGGPYSPKHFFGVGALVGTDWYFVDVGTAGGSGANTINVSLAPRLSATFENVALFGGADFVFRAGDLEIGQPILVRLPKVNAMFSIGAMLLVDTGRDANQ